MYCLSSFFLSLSKVSFSISFCLSCITTSLSLSISLSLPPSHSLTPFLPLVLVQCSGSTTLETQELWHAKSLSLSLSLLSLPLLIQRGGLIENQKQSDDKNPSCNLLIYISKSTRFENGKKEWIPLPSFC